MTDHEFWRLISEVNVAALQSGEEDDAVQPLVRSLATRKPKEIEDFEELLARHLYALDGQVYADNAGESGESDDGFLYARCFVVASGKEFYEAVLADPDKFPNSIDEWCESLLYVAQQAWAEATGKSEDDWEFVPSVSYESGSNEEKWES